MMMKSFGWLVLAGAVLAGCNQGQKAAQNSEAPVPPTADVEVPTATGAADPGAGAAEPGPGVTPPSTARIETPDFKIPDIKIDRAEKGWTKPAPTPEIAKAMTASEVAKKMDESFLNLKNAWVQTSFSYSVPSVGKMHAKSNVKISDKDSFLVEYFLPETSGNMNRMVANNGRTAYMRDGKWVGKKPEFKAASVGTDSGVREWEENFSEEIFSRFLTGEDAWTPIIQAWQGGKAGYKLDMEQKSVKKDGKDHPYYRFLATREGDTKAVVEVRVDAVKYLPVAIRVIRTNKDGSEEKMFWNSQWIRGGTFSDKDFPVPTIKS